MIIYLIIHFDTCSLCKYAVSNSGRIASNNQTRGKNKLGSMLKEVVVAWFKATSRHMPEGTGKKNKNFSQAGRSLALQQSHTSWKLPRDISVRSAITTEVTWCVVSHWILVDKTWWQHTYTLLLWVTDRWNSSGLTRGPGRPGPISRHGKYWSSLSVYNMKASEKVDLTFTGPCIVTVFLSITNKMQRYIIFFIIVNAVHVSSGFSAHHQELKSVHAASGICQTCLLLQLAWMSWDWSACTRKPVASYKRLGNG